MRNLKLIPAGPPANDPQHLLGTERMAELIGGARKSSDFVLLDCPSLETSADALVLAPLVDAFVLVTSGRRGTEASLPGAVTILRSSCAEVTGVVVSGSSLAAYRQDQTTRRRMLPRGSDLQHPSQNRIVPGNESAS
jgi:Mrp family chromosome partitioning ATPase